MINTIPVQVCYYLQQHVDIMEREIPETAPVKESRSRQGVILLNCQVENGQWKRTIEEFIAPQDYWERVRQRASVPRNELVEEQRKSVLARKLEFGLDDSLTFSSDLFNTNVAIRVMDQELPIFMGALYLPTLMPSLPEQALSVGNEWRGKIPVGFGRAEFLVSYVSKLTSMNSSNVTAQMTFEKQSAVFQKRGYTFTLRSAGTWLVEISKVDGTPVTSKGEMQIKVHVRQEVPDERPTEAEILDCHFQFDLQRVPVTFDKTNIYTTAWQIQPGIPLSRPRQ